MKKTITIISTLVLSVLSFSHFQMINTKTLNVDINNKQIPFELIFTHPASNGHTMDIGKNKEGKIIEVESFIVKKGEKVIDAKKYLVKSSFGKAGNKALSYKFNLDSKTGLRGSGTYVLLFNPAPYYEKSEDIYIKQATKVYLQRGEIESEGWNEKQSETGTPVPNAEVEVEFRNYEVKNGQFVGKAKTENSENVIFADKNGMFEFVLTEKGQWGFAALGAGKHDKINDVEVSYDAVLWVEAK